MDKLDFSDMSSLSKRIVSNFFADIFVEAYDTNYDMCDFANKFMNSEFCEKYMDALYSHWQYQNAKVSMEVIEFEITPKKSKNTYVSREACYFIGYIYKQIYLNIAQPSKEIIRLLPFEEMNMILNSKF